MATMSKRKKHLPLMVILWRDHHSNDDWITDDKDRQALLEPSLVHSVGWLHSESDDAYLLVSTLSEEDGSTKQHMNILKADVVNKRIIRQPKTWK